MLPHRTSRSGGDTCDDGGDVQLGRLLPELLPLEEALTCHICYDSLRGPVTLACGHTCETSTCTDGCAVHARMRASTLHANVHACDMHLFGFECSAHVWAHAYAHACLRCASKLLITCVCVCVHACRADCSACTCYNIDLDVCARMPRRLRRLHLLQHGPR
eukprot:356869-Chlamydomonas_euryale.AAC.3